MRSVEGKSWALHHEEGEFYIEVSCVIDGEAFAVRTPCGDGRYLAEIVVERIVAPAIASRPLDMHQFELGPAHPGGEDIRID